MSDSDESGVTYTDISSPFEELSDIGLPRADDHEHLMLLEMLEDPYIESNFEAHPEDDDDEDPQEDPVDYPADGGDDDDDKKESLEDDEDEEDDEMDVEADEEEEHPAPADPVVVAPTAADQAPSAEETEPFETDESAATPPPHPAYHYLLYLPHQHHHYPLGLHHRLRFLFHHYPPILSPPSHVLSPAPPPSLIRSLGYRAAMIRLRDKATSTSHSPPLQLPFASRREDRPEVTLPPRKRLDIALGPRYEVGESLYAAAARLAGGFREDYGFVATGAPVSTDTELGGYVREFETRVRQDTNEIYMRRAYAYTRQLMKTEARMSREAWVRTTDASDLVHGEVMSLCTTVLGQMSEIRELQGADRRRQTVISELLRIDHRRSTEILELRTALQGQVTALQGQVTALQAQVTTLLGQQGLAGDHIQPELPDEAGGSA
nr:hypothetical protein [Tanacetum cinerariifolium]